LGKGGGIKESRGKGALDLANPTIFVGVLNWEGKRSPDVASEEKIAGARDRHRPLGSDTAWLKAIGRNRSRTVVHATVRRCTTKVKKISKGLGSEVLAGCQT